MASIRAFLVGSGRVPINANLAKRNTPKKQLSINGLHAPRKDGRRKVSPPQRGHINPIEN
jgi:hypothetical protein